MWKPHISKHGVAFLQVEISFRSLSTNGYRWLKWDFIVLEGLLHISVAFY